MTMQYEELDAKEHCDKVMQEQLKKVSPCFGNE
jgi:hypothetical protein